MPYYYTVSKSTQWLSQQGENLTGLRFKKQSDNLNENTFKALIAVRFTFQVKLRKVALVKYDNLF